ncbi:MAG: hypothetical protein WAL48_21750 [Xanthobacteraceae bacterium]
MRGALARLVEVATNLNEGSRHRHDDFAFAPVQPDLPTDDWIDEGQRAGAFVQAGHDGEMRRDDRAQFGKLHLKH